MQQLHPGATLQGGKYIINKVLGQGGFGITYLATHSLLTKQTLSPDRMGYCYFLYLGEYTHTLTKGVPSMANIWTVKE